MLGLVQLEAGTSKFPIPTLSSTQYKVKYSHVSSHEIILIIFK